MRLTDATILYRTAGKDDKFYPLYQLFFSPGRDGKKPTLIPSIPKYTIEEIESYYCPQCLENFPSSEAMQFRGRCPRDECFTCAECGSASPPVIDSTSTTRTNVSFNKTTFLSNTTGKNSSNEATCYFRCNFCRWNSNVCGLISDSRENLVSLALKQEQGPEVDYVRMRSRNLQKSLQQQEKQKELNKRLSGRSTATIRSKILLSLAKLEYGSAPPKTGRWLVKDMNAMLEKRANEQKPMLTQIGDTDKNKKDIVLNVEVENNEIQKQNSMEEEVEQKKESEVIDYYQYTCVQLREKLKDRNLNTKGRKAEIVARLEADDASKRAAAAAAVFSKNSPAITTTTINTTTTTTADVASTITTNTMDIPFPLRCKLRTKRSLRCRETFNQGHPGILLKSHINPLTGDSSMRAHMGKWYKKSSFGRDCIPRLAIRKCSSTRSSGITSNVTETFNSEQKEEKDRNDNNIIIVEMTITNPTDIDMNVTLSPISKKSMGKYIADESALYVDTAPSLMKESFYLKRYDELEEQDWSDEQQDVNGNQDPPSIIDRSRNKVVVTIPLVLNELKMNEINKNIIFSLAVNIEEVEKSNENPEVQKSDRFYFGYEVQVILQR